MSGFCSRCSNELRAKNEAARRVHQRDAVEITITFGPDGGVIETKRDPSFVDLKLFGMKHMKTVLVKPNDEAERRAGALSTNEADVSLAGLESFVERAVDKTGLAGWLRTDCFAWHFDG